MYLEIPQIEFLTRVTIIAYISNYPSDLSNYNYDSSKYKCNYLKYITITRHVC